MFLVIVVVMPVAMMMLMAMLAAMIMLVGVVMAVTVVVIMAMIVSMIMLMRASGCIGLERRLDRGDPCAALLEQRLERRVAPHAQPIGKELRRHVAVAERPGEARERGRIGQTRLDQRLGRGNDLDDAAVVEHQRVVGRKRGRLLER